MNSPPSTSWDFEQYSQILIARPRHFVPSSTQVQDFLTSMLARGVIPGTPTISLRTPSDQRRERINPFTHQVEVFQITDGKLLNSENQIAANLANLGEYEIEISGMGAPQTSPIPIECDEPYHVGVTCSVSEKPRSTSNVHQNEPHTAPSFGTPCDDTATDGFFTNPRTGELIRVPDAGCARFWVRFELGKFLCPSLDGGTLDVLNPSIVADAERIFSSRFVQGCYW
jgi:hypothetical protein